MIFEMTEGTDGTSRIEFSGFGKWDATPHVNALTFDSPMPHYTPDRLAVALVLAFGHAFGGRVDFPFDIDVQTVDAIEGFLYPARVHVATFHDGPTKVIEGANRLHLATTLNSIDPAKCLQTDRILTLVPSSEYRGALYPLRGRIVASNSFIFRRKGFDLDFADVSLGVLYAADMNAGGIVLPGEFPAIRKLRKLLASVALQVSVDNNLRV